MRMLVMLGAATWAVIGLIVWAALAAAAIA